MKRDIEKRDTAERLLRDFVLHVERLAFGMEPPNPYTPQFIQACQDVRNRLSSSESKESAAICKGKWNERPGGYAVYRDGELKAITGRPAPMPEELTSLIKQVELNNGVHSHDALTFIAALDHIRSLLAQREERISKLWCSSCLNTGYIDSDGACGNCALGREIGWRKWAEAELERMAR